MVPVHDVVRVREVRAVIGGQEDGAERGNPPLRALEVVREVLHVVGGLHDGIVHHGAGDVDPPHRIGVDGLESVPIHREVGERGARHVIGGREALLRDVVVGLLPLPVAVADDAEHRKRHDEHHERDPEHDAPRAALLLVRALLLIRIAVRGAVPAVAGLHGAIGGLLRDGGTVGARLCARASVRRGAPRRLLLRRSPMRSAVRILSVLGHVHLSDDHRTADSAVARPLS